MPYLFLTILACFLGSFSPQTTEKSDVLIGLVGDVYAKDVQHIQKNLKTRIWHGVFCEDATCSLEPVEISITAVKKNAIGEIVNVSVQQKRAPLFLISSPTLQAQQLDLGAAIDQTLYPGLARLMPNGEWLSVAGFGEPVDEEGNVCISNYLAVLSKKVGKMKDDAKIILAVAKECGGFYPHIDWAGDLDNDQQLDFLINIDYGQATVYFLMLSGDAKNGEAVTRVAQFTKNEGC